MSSSSHSQKSDRGEKIVIAEYQKNHAKNIMNPKLTVKEDQINFKECQWSDFKQT